LLIQGTQPVFVLSVIYLFTVSPNPEKRRVAVGWLPA